MLLARNLLFRLVLFAAILVPRTAMLRAQTAPPAANRMSAIDESSLIVLGGKVLPLASPANVRSEAAAVLPMDRMLLVLTRGSAAESALQCLLSRQQDKSSPD